MEYCDLFSTGNVTPEPHHCHSTQVSTVYGGRSFSRPRFLCGNVPMVSLMHIYRNDIPVKNFRGCPTLLPSAL